MALAGRCLAVDGFSLDFYADRDLDAQGPRAETRHNPLADGSVSSRTGLAFSVTFICVSFFVTLLVAPWALLPWGMILAVIIGLALHFFERPLVRALTLGLLQGLYAIMEGVSGCLTPALGLLAGMFFFAMFGGRGTIDVRDFPQDKVTQVQTLPKRHGIRRTARFTAMCLLIAYALSVVVYFTREFSPIHLYLDLAFIVVGMACAGLFLTRPTPRMAYVLTVVCTMGMGSIICLAMILGSM